MLSIFDRSPRLCDRVSRRAAIRAGGLAWGASCLTGFPVHAATPPNDHAAAKRCIVLFLMGGPPQHSTWDPKPDAPSEVRGEFDAISTCVPGVQIGELLPRTAGLMDKVALLRAVVTGDNAHSSSGYYMMTGMPHAPKNRENANPGAPNNWPTMGAIVRQFVPGSGLLPAAVRLPHHIYNTDGSVWPGQDSGWLGHRADPWLFRCEPAAKDFSVDQFQLSADITLDRLASRRTLLSQFEARLRAADDGSALRAFSADQRQAFDLLNSARARAACDLARESDDTRQRYGRGQFGQSVLLARRLVEAGVNFVQVNWFRGPDEPADNPCWDSHTDESARLRNVLVPPFDMAYSALLTDLEQRGMLDDTLVVCMAEFGRTPKFNARAGRDHWGHVFSIALAGGGVQGGAVHGRSDRQGAYPEADAVAPEDVTATIFNRLGLAGDTHMHDRLNRPLPITRGRAIEAILA